MSLGRACIVRSSILDEIYASSISLYHCIYNYIIALDNTTLLCLVPIVVKLY